MFKKAVIWGCPLHQHTNSYVYAGFYKAFKAMSFDAYWLNESSDVSNMDFSDTLFITEGQHDNRIPKRNDCKYVLHNCDHQKYLDIDKANKLVLQVYTDDVLQWDTENLGNGAFLLKNDRLLFQPWATDLLPEEIDFDDANVPKGNEIHWCGTVGGGQFGNEREIDAFKKESDKDGIRFVFHGPGSTSFEDNRRLICHSHMAPAIHGTWQTEKRYLACRIWKNISYGQPCVTNNTLAKEILEGNAICERDTAKLYHEAKSNLSDKKMTIEAMRIVRDRHTYINRIKTILSVI